MKKRIFFIAFLIILFFLIIMISFGIPSRCFWKLDFGEDHGFFGWGAYYWNFRSNCYLDAVDRTGNAKTCNNILDTAYRASCFNMIAEREHEVKVCDMDINPFSRRLCIDSFAYNSNNISRCSQIDTLRDADLFVGEKELCIYSVAQFTGNVSHCEMIPSGDYQEACILHIMYRYNITFDCNRFREGGEKKDGCLASVGIDTNNISYCYKIITNSERDSCFSYFAGRMGNETLCEEIDYVYTKDTCYENLAKNSNDTRYCDKVSENMRDYCLTGIAKNICRNGEKEKSGAVCSLISDPDNRERCHCE